VFGGPPQRPFGTADTILVSYKVYTARNHHFSDSRFASGTFEFRYRYLAQVFGRSDGIDDVGGDRKTQ
jgi:hypothetical protein